MNFKYITAVHWLIQDAPEAPSPGPSEATPTEPWRAGQSTDVSQWVKREDTEVRMLGDVYA